MEGRKGGRSKEGRREEERRRQLRGISTFFGGAEIVEVRETVQKRLSRYDIGEIEVGDLVDLGKGQG